MIACPRSTRDGLVPNARGCSSAEHTSLSAETPQIPATAPGAVSPPAMCVCVPCTHPTCMHTPHTPHACAHPTRVRTHLLF